MSLTEPPPQDEKELDRPPSRRFTILFTTAMVLIAVGYMWVWQTKTSRTIAELPPPLVLGAVTSGVIGHDRADEIALRDSIAAHLRSIPGLALSQTVEEARPTPVPGRPVARIYRLAGRLDRVEDGRFSLQLRRIDAQTDSADYIYRVHGSSMPEVVHRMAVQVAMSFGLPMPTRDTVPARPARVPASEQPGDNL
jgi:hypothetical protein